MRNQKGFTLIELLVVIAIIGLLLAVIMPALGKAKIYAQEIICKSNLHQYHIATELYVTENRDTFPNPWESLYSKITFIGEAERFCRWHNPEYNLDAYADKRDDPGATGRTFAGPYWPYLAVTKASVCPTFQRVAKSYGQFHPNHAAANNRIEVQFSYSMNGMLYDPANNQSSQTRYVGMSGVKRSQVASSASQTFLWAEENMWLLQDKAAVRLCNYVLNDNALWPFDPSTPNSPIDSFGSFHKISLGKLSTQQPGTIGGVGTYDGGVANVLLMDGSSTFATPLETKLYAGRLR